MDLTDEEKALLASTGPDGTSKGRKRRDSHHNDEPADAAADEAPTRGPITPVQFGGDGWDDLPIQMRG